MIRLELPIPPSVNHCYGSAGKKRFLTKEALDFKRTVNLIWMKNGRPKIGSKSCKVHIHVRFPDKRRRDTGNLDKLLFDSFNKPHKNTIGCGLWDDDSQVVKTTWEKYKPAKPGKLIVEIEPLEDFELPELD